MKILSKLCLAIFLTFVGAVLPVSFSHAAEDYVLIIKNHQFSPQELAIPANTKVKITLENQDSTPEEFESHDLNREKLVTGKGKAVIFVGPLKPGIYKYFGEFHQQTAQGVIIVQ